MSKRLYILLYDEYGGNSLTLPINPEDINITTERDIKTNVILGYGEVPVAGYKKLKRVELSSLLPDNSSYFAILASFLQELKSKPYTKQGSIKMLEDCVEKGKPIRLVIASDAYEDINAEFLVESFSKTLREPTPDIKGAITLIEYRNPDVEVSKYETNRGKLVKLLTRPIRKFIPANMTMQQGATIYKTAKKVYGAASSRSKELAKLNGVIDLNKDIAGEVIDMLALK